MEGESAPIKVGKYGTGEIHGLDDRLATYRTNSPCTVVDFVVQCKSVRDASKLEEYILKWFLDDKTNEVINKPIDDIKDVTFKLINLLDLEYSFLEDEDIENFNKQPMVNFMLTKKTDFQCEICDSYYSTIANLKRHLLEIHDRHDIVKKLDNKIITNFKCSVCHKYLSGKEALKRHIILTINPSR